MKGPNKKWAVPKSPPKTSFRDGGNLTELKVLLMKSKELRHSCRIENQKFKIIIF